MSFKDYNWVEYFAHFKRERVDNSNRNKRSEDFSSAGVISGKPMLGAKIKIIGTILVCTAVFCLQALPVSAQSVSGTQANPSGPFSASLERRRAEQDLRALPVRLREKREQNFKDPKILQKMNEDFLKLQTIRAEIAKTFASGGMVEIARLKEFSEDVKRRASRLRTMLALSDEPEDIDIRLERSPTAESVNDRAFQLCLEISRFTENPLFRANGVLTAKQITEAAKALDTVIALAAAVEKESGRTH